MKYYCGLDVSLKNTAICVVDQDGDIIREAEVPSEPDSIHVWLESLGISFERIGLEAGSIPTWLTLELLARDWPMICIETRHAKAALRAQQIKTDRNDARGIAHIMRTGWYKEVFIKSSQSQKLKVLLSNRRCLLDKRLDIERQIRGTIKVFGLKVGKATPVNFEARIRELIDGHGELQDYILPMLEARRHLREQFMHLEKMVLTYVKQDNVCRRFMTIAGVGPLTALAFKTFIDHPARFRRSRSVGPALGLTPRKYASGEVDYDGRITKCGDYFVRAHLYEAAHVLMSRTNRWCALKAWGMKIAKRSSMKNAYVAVARKLGIIMHRMWVDGTEFQWGSNEQEGAVPA